MVIPMPYFPSNFLLICIILFILLLLLLLLLLFLHYTTLHYTHTKKLVIYIVTSKGKTGGKNGN